MTAGERMVWAARFALAMQAGEDHRDAALLATHAVRCLRDLVGGDGPRDVEVMIAVMTAEEGN